VEVDDETGEVMEGRHIRPFAEWLVEQREGALASELSDNLNELVDAVNMYHKGGTLKLTVKIKPAHRGEGMVLVIDDVTMDLPEAERPEVIYFIDDDKNLSRANPAQPQLPLREVPRTEAASAKETQAK
jgi:hypothetical protein